MNTVHIITADIRSTAKKELPAYPGKMRWVYLARDYRLMRKIDRELGNRYLPINISDILNQVAEEIRDEHIEWIDSLNRKHGSRLYWWFGAVSSRNVYASNLFLYTCYLLTLQRIWQNPETRPNLIVADSPGLAGCIEAWIKEKNPDIKVTKQTPTNAILLFLRWLVRYPVSAGILAMRFISAIVTRIGTKTHITPLPRTIINTYIHDYSISDEGIFQDRYFPFLHEYLLSEKHPVLVHPVLYGFRYTFASIYRRMRKSATSFIIQEDHLRLSDYVAALAAPFSLYRMKVVSERFRDLDLAPVIQEEHRLQPPFPVMQSVLTYRLWPRLKKAGIMLKGVIVWYENQVTDKALIAGVKAAYPDIVISGAQMFIHIPNYLSLYPSRAEFEFGYTPDVLLEMGEEQRKTALKYAHAIPCRIAAALRYSSLFKEQFRNKNGSSEKSTILVILPSFMDEALEILSILRDAMHEVADGVEYLIKCHPDLTSLKEVVEAFGTVHWPKEFKMWEGSLSDAFQMAAIVIVSNSSSMVESVVKGIPTIFVGRRSNLNMNPLAEDSFANLIACFDEQGLAKAIAHYLSLSRDKKMSMAREGLELRNRYFTDVNYDSLNSFRISERIECK